MRYLLNLVSIGLFVVGQFAQAQSTGSEQGDTDQQTVERNGEQDSGTMDVLEYEEGTQAITEYRRFGQLYMLKVKPKGAAPLYMIDQYGDGELNRRPAESIEDDVNLPKWRLGSF